MDSIAEPSDGEGLVVTPLLPLHSIDSLGGLALNHKDLAQFKKAQRRKQCRTCHVFMKRTQSWWDARINIRLTNGPKATSGTKSEQKYKLGHPLLKFISFLD